MNFFLIILDTVMENNEVLNIVRNEYTRTPKNSTQNLDSTSIYSNIFLTYIYIYICNLYKYIIMYYIYIKHIVLFVLYHMC